METCPKCAAAHEQGATFCGACGFGLRGTPSPVLSAASSAVPRFAPAFTPSGATGAPRPEIMDGAMVGEYQVTALIGEGGMGTVYAGVQPLIGKKVAIKILKAELSRDPEVMERFLAEARAVNKIGHPNIVDVFSFGAFADGSQYFVMELLAGRSLSAYLEEVKPIGYAAAYSILAPVFDALEAAHQRNIIHRDLKPDNIFLGDRPGGGFMVKLLDFGIAKFTDEGMMSGHTRTGVPMGTPLYMSPEQCRGRDIGVPSDIYSLGVILYEMFSGTPPFVAESFYEVISAHLTKVPPPLHTIAEVPAPVEAVVHKCLAKDKVDRYATVAELREALMPVLQELAGTAAAPVALGKVPSLSRIPSVREAAAMRSRTGLYVGLGVIGVLIVGGAVGVALVLKKGREPTPVPVVAAPALKEPVDAGGPRTVMIQLMLNPPDVKPEIFVDGKKHDKLEIETPMSKTRTLEVKITAAGYQPFVATTRPTADLVIPVNLTKIGEPPRAGGRRPLAPAVKTAPGVPPAPPPARTPPPPPRVQRIDKL